MQKVDKKTKNCDFIKIKKIKIESSVWHEKLKHPYQAIMQSWIRMFDGSILKEIKFQRRGQLAI